MNFGRREKLRAVIILLMLVALASSFALVAGPSGLVIGIPGSCISKVSLSGPNSLDLQPGELNEIKVTLSNISCGISYVRLRIEDIPQYYTTGPSYYSTISPKQSREFSVFFDIPMEAEIKSYTGTYKLYTSEGTFNLGTLDLSIVAAEKPSKKIIQTSVSSAEVELEKETGLTLFKNKELLGSIAILSAVLAFILAGYEYFAVSEGKQIREALKREEDEIYRALHLKPKEKHGFGKALKAGKKQKK